MLPHAVLRVLIFALPLTLLLGGPANSGELRLLMLDQEYCEWCEAWEEEIGVVYHKTAEGKRAPLIRASIHEPLPEGITLARRAHFTPTFVLLQDGREVGRIDGYPGEDFFYGLLEILLNRVGAPAGDGASG